MKTLAMTMGAMLLLCGAQTVQAQGFCASDARAVRSECLRYGGHPRECAAIYRDDMRECRRGGLMRHLPVSRPMPPPRPMPPRPAPPQRPVTLPAPNR